MKRHWLPILAASTCFASLASAQQVADTAFVAGVPIPAPTWASGEGPNVLIDGGHHNFHTADGRYFSFAELLRRDGYRVRGSDSRITAESLHDVAVVVISNALHESNQSRWQPPIAQAFADAEVAVLRDWVSGGGRLLLIADHSPFPEAIASLAAALDLSWVSGSAGDGVPMLFRKSDGTLAEHAVTTGIDSIATFGGSAFEIRRPGTGLLVFGPDVSGPPDEEGVRPRLQGYLQGGLVTFGEGVMAAFGEAAMFSAQILSVPGTEFDEFPMGFNNPAAGQNPRFILNLMRWLTQS